MRIDTHAHYFPAEYIEGLTPFRPMLARYKHSQQFQKAANLAETIESMGEADIDHAIIGIGSHQPYLPEEEAALRLARVCNDAYAGAVADNPVRFSALGCLPLPHVSASVAEAQRCMNDLHFKGFVLGTKAGEVQLDDDRLTPVFTKLNEHGAIVQIHPSEGSKEPHGLNIAVMGPHQVCMACARLCLSGVITRFPRIRFIATCLGGGLPFFMSRIERFATANPILGASEKEQIQTANAFRRLYYDTESATPVTLRCTCQAVGVDRIVFGTNHPFENMADDARIIDDSELSTTDAEAIMSTNPHRLLDM